MFYYRWRDFGVWLWSRNQVWKHRVANSNLASQEQEDNRKKGVWTSFPIVGGSKPLYSWKNTIVNNYFVKSLYWRCYSGSKNIFSFLNQVNLIHLFFAVNSGDAHLNCTIFPPAAVAVCYNDHTAIAVRWRYTNSTRWSESVHERARRHARRQNVQGIWFHHHRGWYSWMCASKSTVWESKLDSSVDWSWYVVQFESENYFTSIIHSSPMTVLSHYFSAI